MRVGGATGGRELSIDRYFHLVLAAHAASLLAFAVSGQASLTQATGDLETSHTRRLRVIGVGWDGRCASGVGIAPREEGRVEVSENSTSQPQRAEGLKKAMKDEFMVAD